MNRLAIVTGGSRGLGAALCDQYFERGWRVLELSRSGRSDRPGIEHVDLDLAQPELASRTVLTALEERLQSDLDEVHFVSNAAALLPVGPPTAEGREGWIEHLTVNVISGIGVMSAFLGAAEGLEARKVLVNVSSGASTSAIRGWSLYCASKAGLDHFVRTVAVEQADLPQPTLAINFAPGVVDTEMQTTIRASDPALFPDHQRFVDRHREGGLSSPTDAARAMLEQLAGELEQGESYRV